MSWVVLFDDQFEVELERLPQSVQDELLANAKVLEQFGPTLGRPIGHNEGIAPLQHERASV